MVSILSSSGGGSRVEFRCHADAGRSVALAGSFNDWEPQPMRNIGGGEYVLELTLGRGCYEYRLVIDGEWCDDRSNSNFAPNDFGTLNSVFTIE